MSPIVRNLNEDFAHVLHVVSSQRFLNKQGLGNEVPFFICPYPAQQAIDAEKHIRLLGKKLQAKGVQVLEINLYDLSIELLKRREIFATILEQEQDYSKAELKELLQGVLDPEQHLIPAIAATLAETAYDVLFITGVGAVFPYIRSHNILNNLQSTAKEKPTVMFFPGEYSHSLETGASLDLFGKLHDDKYYRAFNIFHYEV